MAGAYVLPNRKAFADYITRIFLKHRDKPTDDDDKDVDLCTKRGNARELLPHQKIVRDYLMAETPYRGLLVYHGLGSGKTCSSIAVAESLLSDRKVFVMLPASLEINYRGELRKCGDPIYAYEQHWEMRELSDTTRAEARKLGISDGFLDRNGKFFVTIPNQEPNFNVLPMTARTLIGKQIEDILDQRFTFIRYNGISSGNISNYAPTEGPNPYDNSVVIIDEVHEFISRVSNASDLGRRLYDAVYTARNCKVVALSGTPVVNRATEIAFLMNLLRGPIERINIPIQSIPTWDEEKMKNVLQAIPDVDTIEFNTLKKTIMVTRNPPHFRSVYNEAGERIAVQYHKDVPFTEVAADWVRTFQNKFQLDVGGAEIAMERITTEQLQCLPTEMDAFAALFLDGLNIKNPLLFARRIQGLVSYFKGADERLMPRRVDDDKMLEEVPMSSEQFGRYLTIRWEEIKRDKRRITPGRADDSEMKTFRVNSRLACNYAIPADLVRDPKEIDENVNEDAAPGKEGVLQKLRENPQRYLTENALKSSSPKLLRMLENVRETLGTDPSAWKNQFVYSQYRTLEGLGVFAAILDANGWQPYKIVKENGQWIEDKTMDAEKPAYAFYTGEEDKDQRDMMRQVFNNIFADDFPASLKASVEARGKKLLCLLMASSSGATGITLANVRRVHIMEPHWNPARHDQVIGRAIRICSHAKLRMEERTVRVSFYLSTFTPEQAKSTEGSNNIVPIRRSDTSTKRYAGAPVEAFMTTDEYLYETTFEKDITNKRLTTLLKQAAVDCEIHRKLHSRETPVLSCMRFDSASNGESLAYKPNIRNEDPDLTYLRNTQRRKRRLQKVMIKQMVFLIDPESKEVFDGPAFEDNQRLLRVGVLVAPGQIKWSLP
jgi:hypothetical protein